jgi:hypothetical protein
MRMPFLQTVDFERTERGSLEGVTKTETGREEVVFRSVHHIVANVREQSDVWRKAIFQTYAAIPENFVVVIAATQPMRISEGSDAGERIVLVK